jgi:hypothetical protein
MRRISWYAQLGEMSSVMTTRSPGRDGREGKEKKLGFFLGFIG